MASNNAENVELDELKVELKATQKTTQPRRPNVMDEDLDKIEIDPDYVPPPEEEETTTHGEEQQLAAAPIDDNSDSLVEGDFEDFRVVDIPSDIDSNVGPVQVGEMGGCLCCYACTAPCKKGACDPKGFWCEPVGVFLLSFCCIVFFGLLGFILALSLHPWKK